MLVLLVILFTTYFPTFELFLHLPEENDAKVYSRQATN